MGEIDDTKISIMTLHDSQKKIILYTIHQNIIMPQLPSNFELNRYGLHM